MSSCHCPTILGDCIGVDSPITGISSETDDGCFFYASCSPRADAFAPPPLGGGITTQSCAYTVLSGATQAEADALAAAACGGGQPPLPPPPPHPPCVPISETLPDGSLGAPYFDTLNSVFGIGPRTFTTTDALPGGLTLDPSGLISGTPTTPGTTVFTASVTDSLGATCTDVVTIRIGGSSPAPPHPPCTPISETLPDGFVGTPYFETLNSTFGIGPYTFTTVDALPVGLTLDPSGLISGTPTTPGTTTFTVTVTDSMGFTCTDVVTITVGADYYNIVVDWDYCGNANFGAGFATVPPGLPAPFPSGTQIIVLLSGYIPAIDGWIRVQGNIGSIGGPAFDTGLIVVPYNGSVSYGPYTFTLP